MLQKYKKIINYHCNATLFFEKELPIINYFVPLTSLKILTFGKKRIKFFVFRSLNRTFAVEI